MRGRIQQCGPFSMRELVGLVIDRAEAFECTNDGRRPEVGLVVLQFRGQVAAHRFFVDAGLAVWEELSWADAVRDFADCRSIALPNLVGSRMLRAECERRFELDELHWATTTASVRMRFEDPADLDSRAVLEVTEGEANYGQPS